MQTLIIYGHPNPESSTANKTILESLKKLEPNVQIRTLADHISPIGFDIAAEQNALRNADVVVLQFPLYWYSVPALLKKWIDEVFAHGFAYGTGGTALHGKQLVLSFTTGADASSYVKDGAMGWSVEDFMPPLLQTGHLCGFKTVKTIYSTGMMFIPHISSEEDRQDVIKKASIHAQQLAQAIAVR